MLWVGQEGHLILRPSDTGVVSEPLSGGQNNHTAYSQTFITSLGSSNVLSTRHNRFTPMRWHSQLCLLRRRLGGHLKIDQHEAALQPGDRVGPALKPVSLRQTAADESYCFNGLQTAWQLLLQSGVSDNVATTRWNHTTWKKAFPQCQWRWQSFYHLIPN